MVKARRSPSLFWRLMRFLNRHIPNAVRLDKLNNPNPAGFAQAPVRFEGDKTCEEYFRSF